jgi:flagellar hook-associated protein 3 FlgL
MKVGSISTLAMRDAARASIARTQSRLDEAVAAVAGGRHHDVGLVLGAETARAIDMRQVVGEIDAIMRSNGLTASRLSEMQSVLTATADLANGFFETVVSSRQSGTDRSLLVADARARLGTLTSLLSTTSDGAHIFGGVNTAVTPLENYLAEPPGRARSAVRAAFAAEFGFAPDGPQARSITPSQLQAYLDGAYSAIFRDPAWQSTFSSASDAPIRDRISPREVVETPVSANSPGIRSLVSALVAVIDTGTEQLDSETFLAFVDSVAATASTAAGELVRDQAAVGIVQERLTKASERMMVQHGLLEGDVGRLERVDTVEASTRLSMLAAQLEVSYAITSRLQKLSLITYL